MHFLLSFRTIFVFSGDLGNLEKKKSRIRETLNLSTDANHRTDNFLKFFG